MRIFERLLYIYSRKFDLPTFTYAHHTCIWYGTLLCRHTANDKQMTFLCYPIVYVKLWWNVVCDLGFSILVYRMSLTTICILILGYSMTVYTTHTQISCLKIPFCGVNLI